MLSLCRQISGAMIRISNSEELREGCTDRVITITGNPDSVALAQYLINMRYGNHSVYLFHDIRFYILFCYIVCILFYVWFRYNACVCGFHRLIFMCCVLCVVFFG